MKKNPTSENVSKVIANFEKVLPKATRQDHLKMLTPHVNCMGHECGTIHCHGGWYAVATCDSSKPLDFRSGIIKMSEDLGFDIDGDFFTRTEFIEDWAKYNPEIWGNNNGTYMFSNRLAFESEDRPGGAYSLNDIISHWKEVRDRLITIERGDITKSLAVLPVNETPDLAHKPQVV